jgi:hypothetical protein
MWGSSVLLHILHSALGVDMANYAFEDLISDRRWRLDNESSLALDEVKG